MGKIEKSEGNEKALASTFKDFLFSVKIVMICIKMFTGN